MGGNRLRSFVTRDGRVIRVRAEAVGAHPPRQRPSNNDGVARAYARCNQHRPAGANGRFAGRAAAGRVDMPGLPQTVTIWGFMLLGIVCVLVIILAVAGICGAGKWIFSGENRTADVKVKSARREMGTAGSQKPGPLQILPKPPEIRGYVREPISQQIQSMSSSGTLRTGSDQRDTAGESFPTSISQRNFSYPSAGNRVNEEISQQIRPKIEPETYERQRRMQAAPAVSREPAVDYMSSIREMEGALEAQSAEIRKVTEDLRNIWRDDKNDQSH
mgnify:CR=1 FL=1